MKLLPRLRRFGPDPLRGPLPALPTGLDAVAERWAGLAPRVRVVIISLAVVTLLTVSGRGAVRSPWGAPVTAVVVSRDLLAGEAISPDDLGTVTLPEGALPRDALREPPIAGRAAGPIGAGRVLTTTDVRAGGPADDLAPGNLALPVPRSEGIELGVGERIDLYATDPQSGGARLARDARVIAVDDAHLWVEVSADEAPAVAAASAWGEVLPALRSVTAP